MINWTNKMNGQKKQRIANEYIQPALEIYFQNAGVDPFKEQ